MKNYVQQGHTLTLTAPANVLSGDGVLVGSLFGVAATHAQEGQPVECAVVGVFALPKAAGEMIQGALAYWDDTAKQVTGTEAANHLIGHVTETAASGDPTVRVRLSA